MDITPENTNRIFLLSAISLVISLSLLFQDQLKVAGTYVSHWTYQIAPSCRRCDFQTLTLDQTINLEFGLPPNWAISSGADGKSFQLNRSISFAPLTGLYIFIMDAEQLDSYEAIGLSEYAIDWLNDTVDPKVGNTNTVSKFGRSWEHATAETGIRFGKSLTSRPSNFEIYISEVEGKKIQLVTTKSSFQSTFNLIEQDQLDMIINSLTVD